MHRNENETDEQSCQERPAIFGYIIHVVATKILGVKLIF